MNLVDIKINSSIPITNNSFLIKSNERIIIKPNERKIISTYLRIENNKDNIFIFEPDLNLLLNGTNVLWTNLNDAGSLHCIQLLLFNLNIEDGEATVLTSIVGSRKNIDLKPNTLLGKVFIIKKIIDKTK